MMRAIRARASDGACPANARSGEVSHAAEAAAPIRTKSLRVMPVFRTIGANLKSEILNLKS
jgi:hypothetical protein